MAKKTFTELRDRQVAINIRLSDIREMAETRELTTEEKNEVKKLTLEYDNNSREITLINQEREAQRTAPAQKKSANVMMREFIEGVRMHKVDNDVKLQRDATNSITSAQMQAGEFTNMQSAGIPLTIGDLINPLEMETVYDKLGIKIATGVRGQIQWPCLDTAAQVTVGGELDAVPNTLLDFSKITAQPVKLGISIAVDNEAINDASFDLVGTIIAQMNAAVGRTLNSRVLALTAPGVKANFVGPLVSKKQTETFTTASAPTYAELKAMKGKTLGSGAKMAGFCYIMDAAMYSQLEATPKDAGSGRFIIEGGKIDGDIVFVTDLADYAGKVAAGCFGYTAVNQHGDAHFIVDPYTKASTNETVFTLNADWSITVLVSTKASKAPFVVGA